MAAPESRRSSQSGSSAMTRARLSRIVVVAWRRLLRSWGLLRASLAPTGKAGIPMNARLMTPSRGRAQFETLRSVRAPRLGASSSLRRETWTCLLYTSDAADEEDGVD